jgi:dolichol-phosphate mannosyltransferase
MQRPMSGFSTAVVIATYNEADTIGGILQMLNYNNCIPVVVDDNSPDGTAEIIRRVASRAVLIERPEKSGIASAYLRGLKAALSLKTDYVVQMDAGGTHDPFDVMALATHAHLHNYDLVIGSRFAKPFQWQGYRTAISLLAALLMRVRGVRVHDATSGLRCWRSHLLSQVNFDEILSNGFAFQLETLMAAHRLGAQIGELPIPYKLTGGTTFHRGMILEALRAYGRFWR